MAVYYDHVENKIAIKLTLVVSLILSVGIYIYISCYGIYLNTNKYWKDCGKNMTKNLTKRMGGYYHNHEMKRIGIQSNGIMIIQSS